MGKFTMLMYDLKLQSEFSDFNIAMKYPSTLISHKKELYI